MKCITFEEIRFIKGVFCISLDFEQFWGIRDVRDDREINTELNNIQTVTKQLFQLFEQNKMRVTWATVGLLAHNSLEDLLAKNSISKIPYKNQAFSPFPLKKNNLDNLNSTILFAPQLITSIATSAYQELGSHTYSHYYCLELGQSEKDFIADLEQMQKIAHRLNHTFKSIVFPRNQVNEKYLHIAKTHNIKSYRGNQQNRFWRNSSFHTESIFKKTFRVLDAYIPISKTIQIGIEDLKAKEEFPVNIPANRFLRPFRAPNFIERMKINRIKKEMTDAAINSKIYHLWWHPHNFALNNAQNMQQLQEIIAHYHSLNEKYDFESLTMSEIAEHAQ